MGIGVSCSTLKKEGIGKERGKIICLCGREKGIYFSSLMFYSPKNKNKVSCDDDEPPPPVYDPRQKKGRREQDYGDGKGLRGKRSVFLCAAAASLFRATRRDRREIFGDSLWERAGCFWCIAAKGWKSQGYLRTDG